MNELIPSEDEFDVIISALDSHEKTLYAEVLAKAVMEVIPSNLSDADAFERAFSKKVDYKEINNRCKTHREMLTVLSAKLIKLRDYLRNHTLTNAITQITQ